MIPLTNTKRAWWIAIIAAVPMIAAGFGLAGEPVAAGPVPPSSSGFAGVAGQAVSGHLFFAATPHAGAVSSAMADEDGIPVWILCYDEKPDWIRCSISVHPLLSGGQCGEPIARRLSTDLGISVVETRIPKWAYEGQLVTLFCVDPGINGVNVGNPTIFTVVGDGS